MFRSLVRWKKLSTNGGLLKLVHHPAFDQQSCFYNSLCLSVGRSACRKLLLQLICDNFSFQGNYLISVTFWGIFYNLFFWTLQPSSLKGTFFSLLFPTYLIVLCLSIYIFLCHDVCVYLCLESLPFCLFCCCFIESMMI